MRIKGTAQISFSPHIRDGDERREVEVKIRYRFLEGEKVGRDAAVLMIEEPKGWQLLPGRVDTYRGFLELGRPAEFNYESDDYDSEWTGRLSVTADFVAGRDSSPLADNSSHE